MVETDDDTYKLNADGRNQTLRVSLINNEQISLILTNVNSNQNFTALITLEQFVEVCEAFKSAAESAPCWLPYRAPDEASADSAGDARHDRCPKARRPYSS